MKKYLITILLITASVMFLSPMNTMALENNNVGIIEKNASNLLTNTINIADSACTESDSVLGNVDCENSVAWLLQLIFDIIKVVGPILVILLSSLDFIMVIIKSDNEQFQKAQKRLITRLVLAVLLFLVPVIVEFILKTFGIIGVGTAGIK